MTAELHKLRALPLPRWAAAVTGLALLSAIIVALFQGVGPEDGAAVGLGVELPTYVAAIVLGAWIVGLEYGQGTIRRALTADPRRIRFVLSKYGAAAAATAALTVLAFVVAVIAFPPIASANDQSLPVSDVIQTGGAALVGNVAFALLGASIALICRSMAGGMVVALLFAFVIDSALTAIPRVGDWTAQAASSDLYDAMTGEPGAPSALRSALVLTAWIGAFALAGMARFVKTDV
jgi:ABC-type transport system involved in multi-copper enzyme maturation permease subunit